MGKDLDWKKVNRNSHFPNGLTFSQAEGREHILKTSQIRPTLMINKINYNNNETMIREKVSIKEDILGVSNHTIKQRTRKKIELKHQNEEQSRL